MGQNVHGEAGLFPSNYVELVEDGQEEEGTAPAHAEQQSHIDPTPSAPAAGPPAGAGPGGPTATALYDYEAAEDNEISFPDGATIANVVSNVALPSLLLETYTMCRNSRTTTGGWESTVGSLACSPPITYN